MRFYTNIVQWGNNLLLREVVNGKRINRKVKYSPTLFRIPKDDGERSLSQHKTLQGNPVVPKKFETIKKAREWVEKYREQTAIYGNTQFAYNYIADEYPNEMSWDIDEILIVTIDIEVECENGFPKPEEANDPLLSITIKNHQNKKLVVWGIGDFENSRDDVSYVKCDTEKHL
ncbi:uncharacterized protein METZ01_LOCUS379341, partial [marine metagenome]